MRLNSSMGWIRICAFSACSKTPFCKAQLKSIFSLFQLEVYCRLYWCSVWGIPSWGVEDQKISTQLPWRENSCMSLLHCTYWTLVSWKHNLWPTCGKANIFKNSKDSDQLHISILIWLIFFLLLYKNHALWILKKVPHQGRREINTFIAELLPLNRFPFSWSDLL